MMLLGLGYGLPFVGSAKSLFWCLILLSTFYFLGKYLKLVFSKIFEIINGKCYKLNNGCY